MMKQKLRISFKPNDLLFPIIVVFSGLILGIAFSLFPPFLVLGTLVAVIFIYAMFKRPEIGLLGILVATSSIVFEDQLPMLSMGGISFHIPDLILLSLLALIILRRLAEPDFKIVHTPLDRPLLIFYGITLLSTIIAVIQSSVEVQEALRALRVLSYYLTFFIVTNLVRERRQLNFLLNGLFLLATIVAAAMIMQYFFGASLPFLPGRVETLNTQGSVYEDVTRILPPGWSIVMVSGAAIFCILVQEKFKTLAFPKYLQFGLLGIAIVITFIRAYWAALIFVFFLSAFLVNGRGRQRIFGWLIVAFFLLVVILPYSTGEPKSQVGKLVEATYARMGTLWNPKTLNESSLQWRYVENGYALGDIVSHPLLGLGLGAFYRPYDPRIDYPGMGGDLRGYIHNGHLGILLNSGLLGYIAFIGFSLTFLIRGFRYRRAVKGEWLKGVVLGFTLIYLAALIAAVTVPTFTVWGWIPVIGIIMGINEVILMKFRQEESDSGLII